MTHTLDTLPIDRRRLEQLAEQQLISAEAYADGVAQLDQMLTWGTWTARLLLTLGVALILAGAFCFFAFNWADMSATFKLGLIGGTMVLCLACAYAYGLTRLGGQFLLLSASACVGLFLAVFGQIYQTGADSYTLFLTWTMLILPWTLISNFAPLWALWTLIANLAALLWWAQSAYAEPQHEALIFSLLCLGNSALLALRELALAQGAQWLKPRWTRIALALMCLSMSLVAPMEWIQSPTANLEVLWGISLAATLYCSFFWIYRSHLPDVGVLAATALTICILIDHALFKLVIDQLHLRLEFALLLLGALTLGLFTLAVRWLRQLTQDSENLS